jgi:RNA polymerase sigma-70 factor, ECF subfamily
MEEAGPHRRMGAFDPGVPHTVDYTALEDREVVSLACEGRERAFKELLVRYERPVFSLVFRMVRDRGLSEDLAQETFIRAFNAIDGYDPRYKFSSWIFKIANNLTIDHLRKRKLDTVSLDGSPDATTDEEISRTRITAVSGDEAPDAYVENQELGSQIEDAIARLRPEYRTAVLLRHVEGHSYDEVAEIMELPLGTVKTYLHRARSELKQILAMVAA